MWLFRKKKKLNGYIGFFNLENFWFKTLNEKERQIVLENFNSGSIGVDSTDLLETKLFGTREKLSFISGQISRYKKPIFKNLGLKFIEIGNEELQRTTQIIEKHFYYQRLIEFHYRFRAEENNYELAINACMNQIEISEKAKIEFEKEIYIDQLPSHKGFKQLAIILEKEKKFNEAIKICQKAITEGWNGDWNYRIERMNKKLKN